MKLAGDAKRIELLPETDEDKKAIQVILEREDVIRQVLNDSHPLIYWGDSDEDGGRGGLIINLHKVEKTVSPTTEAFESGVTAPA